MLRKLNNVWRYGSPLFCSELGTDALASQWYKHAHAKEMSLRAIARLIQTMLYAKRFFPYYVYNILGGIEEDGSPVLSPHFDTVTLISSIRNWRRLLL